MFSNFVSLGGTCYTASSMSKYGLRSFSGPFDWLVTGDFAWIMHYLENSFEDFLEKENLERWNGYAEKFRDTKSGFLFLHDEEYPFEENYSQLKLKYQKKTGRFMEEVKKPTCFLRLVADAHEIKYISENYDYISRVVKMGNQQNEIIFLIKDTMAVSEKILFKHYLMSIKHIGKNTPTHEELRNAFDGSADFLLYCASNYSSESMMKNIIFDHKKEKIFRNDQARYRTLMKLLEFDFDKIEVPEEIAIYGAGNIGKQLYQRIKEKCKIRYFVDQGKTGKIDGISICRLEEIDYGENISFIVTPTYDFTNIYEKIKNQYITADIISLDDMIDVSC